LAQAVPSHLPLKRRCCCGKADVLMPSGRACTGSHGGKGTFLQLSVLRYQLNGLSAATDLPVQW